MLLKLALWQGVHLHTVKDSVQCIRDTVVESVISLILESCKHAKSSVGDKLKVVQFHPVIRKSVDSITQNNKLRLAPTRCSLDSQHVHIRCSLPVKNTKKPGQRTSGWRQSRCSLDSPYVTNHTLTVREGVITQSRAKSPGAPQTSTLSLCLIEQLALWQGEHLHTVKDSVQCIRDTVVESVISLILESCKHAKSGSSR